MYITSIDSQCIPSPSLQQKYNNMCLQLMLVFGATCAPPPKLKTNSRTHTSFYFVMHAKGKTENKYLWCKGWLSTNFEKTTDKSKEKSKPERCWLNYFLWLMGSRMTVTPPAWGAVPEDHSDTLRFFFFPTLTRNKKPTPSYAQFTSNLKLKTKKGHLTLLFFRRLILFTFSTN